MNHNQELCLATFWQIYFAYTLITRNEISKICIKAVTNMKYNLPDILLQCVLNVWGLGCSINKSITRSMNFADRAKHIFTENNNFTKLQCQMSAVYSHSHMHLTSILTNTWRIMVNVFCRFFGEGILCVQGCLASSG